ncbi:myosin regulatory light chain 10 isoform X2 [Mycteria americana]|uniref:myosin regulatory light chain 10 isoform X2 n=1 Tax=Mycteria americana TaxID=33587 RepID=UPI003F586680
MFEQTQIQEFKEAFTIMDQNRDGFIDKADLRDTFAALGRLNVKNEELEDMVKEAPGPINFTVFLTMFGEKLKGTDPEETILNAFKIFDPEGKGHIKADYVQSPIQNEPVLGWTTAIKKMTVLHRSDGERLTEDTGGKFKRKALSDIPLLLDWKSEQK